ncbi:MAG: HtaA domain-containing protein [Pseudomonadota bacterium]|uniref:HtaA domain-containing protein n=1 Tax=Phenylobacterium sp. TaxID=1871053 RepID=UPI0025FE8B4B|nr:HtaA domain-containing protein [Phenylobacterium sp.]MBT9473741.1 HtaA domain-containing protein [Phenylobacterium sp.]
MSQDRVQTTSLSWGVKQSFRNYVEATGGVTQASDGAARDADGGFTFTALAGGDLHLGADGKLQGTGKFQGELRFEAHGGMLSVCLVDPAVEVDADGAALTVADSPARTRRLEIARLDLSAMTPGEAGEMIIPTALSMDGVQLLGDHYPPRTPLDPVRLVLP